MTLKCTILFSVTTGATAVGNRARAHSGGWSETVLFGGTDVPLAIETLTNGAANLPALLPARAAMLPDGAAIIGVRIAQAYPRVGRSQIFKRFYAGTAGILTDVPQMALQFSAPAVGANNIRRWTCRGIPDFWVSAGEYVPGSGDAEISNYFQALRNFQFAGRDLTQPLYDVDTITAQGVMTLFQVPGWQINDSIFVKNTVDPTGVKFNAGRLISALAGGGNIVTLANWGVGDSKGGKAQRRYLVVNYIDSNRAQIDRVVVRKVGRPFEQYRGRRSKKTAR